MQIFIIKFLGIVRKEREIKARVNPPSGELKKSDHEVFKQYEENDSKKRRMVLEQIAKTGYNKITKDIIDHIVNKLCKRISLFNGNYPLFIRDLVKELMEHPNTTPVNKQVFHKFFYEKIDVRNILQNF